MGFPRCRSFQRQSFTQHRAFSETVGSQPRGRKRRVGSTIFRRCHELSHQWVMRTPADWRPGAGIEHDVGDTGAVFRLCADAEKMAKIYAQSAAPLSGPVSTKASRRFAAGRLCPAGAARTLCLVPTKGRPDPVHSGRLYWRGQGGPGAPQFPDAITVMSMRAGQACWQPDSSLFTTQWTSPTRIHAHACGTRCSAQTLPETLVPDRRQVTTVSCSRQQD